MHRMTLRLTYDRNAQLELMARVTGMPKAEVVRVAIRELFERVNDDAFRATVAALHARDLESVERSHESNRR